MEVELTADQRAFARQAIASGRLRNQREAVAEALALWERRERNRAELLVAIEEAEASLRRDEARPLTPASVRTLEQS